MLGKPAVCLKQSDLMKFTPKEARFLTALTREQNQTGCKGPAHDLLRRHAYSDSPILGPGSLAFSYEAVPLTSLLLRDFEDLQRIDDFLRNSERVTDPEWPWSSAQAYRARLEEARAEYGDRQESVMSRAARKTRA
jgi:hypothetical protein